MTKSKQRQSLRGAVLIMILTVMVVLIIMLMATLTVVTSAGQRVYTKFEENQAYYTARSALDVFTKNMLMDSGHVYSAGGYEYSKDDWSDTETADMKQGLALQLELYKIKSKGEYKGNKEREDAFTAASITDEAAKKAALGFAENMTADDAEEIFGSVGGSDAPECAHFSISDTNIDFIEYTVTLPQITDSADPTKVYGKLVDEGTDTATIKVEVLERVYATNPEKTIQQIVDAVKSVGTDDDDEIKDAIKEGNRSQDKFKLKITSTVQFMDTEGTAVLIYDTTNPPVNNSSRALTTFGGSGSDNMNIVGGFSVTRDVDWGNTGIVVGASYTEGNFDYSTGPNVYLTSGESFFVSGDMNVPNHNFTLNSAAPAGITEDEKPFIYVGGTLIAPNADNANIFNNVDILTNGIKLQGNGFQNTAGNIYCNGDFILVPDNPLASISDSTVDGDVYVKGNVVLKAGDVKNLHVKGDLIIDGNLIGGGKTLTVDGDLHITGDFDATGFTNGGSGLDVDGEVFVNGKLIVPKSSAADVGIRFDGTNLYIPTEITGNVSVMGGIYSRDAGTDTQIKHPSIAGASDTAYYPAEHDVNETATSGVPSINLNFPTLDDIKNPLGTEEKIEIELPNGVKKQIPTHVENFNTYYVTNDAGQLLDASGVIITDATVTPPVPISAESKSGIANFNAAANASNYVTSGMTIDVAAGTEKYILSPGNLGTIKVQGGGTVEFYLQNSPWSNEYQFQMEVADDTTVNFYGEDINTDALSYDAWGNVSGGVDYKFFTCTVKTDTVMTQDPLQVGSVQTSSDPDEQIKVPKINYYFSEDVVLHIYNRGFYTGYFYCPDAILYANDGGYDVDLTYNGANLGDVKTTIVGSVLAGGIIFPNNNGVAYINPELEDSGTKGEPHLAFAPSHYTRN
ncbi:MAG: hypothetical protein J6K17_13535 [Oscillospiraceae bacterium]|nr:hypothetical protein [Oscillospiraceae bacterium]